MVVKGVYSYERIIHLCLYFNAFLTEGLWEHFLGGGGEEGSDQNVDICPCSTIHLQGAVLQNNENIGTCVSVLSKTSFHIQLTAVFLLVCYRPDKHNVESLLKTSY